MDSGHCTHSSKVSLQRSLGPRPSKDEEQLMIPPKRGPQGLFHSGDRRGWERTHDKMQIGALLLEGSVSHPSSLHRLPATWSLILGKSSVFI